MFPSSTVDAITDCLHFLVRSLSDDTEKVVEKVETPTRFLRRKMEVLEKIVELANGIAAIVVVLMVVWVPAAHNFLTQLDWISIFVGEIVYCV